VRKPKRSTDCKTNGRRRRKGNLCSKTGKEVVINRAGIVLVHRENRTAFIIDNRYSSSLDP
jgi:hypothetical protein